MCGRMVLTRSASEIAEAFELETDLELQPRYNVAPSQAVPAVRADASGGRRLDPLRWGLVPFWARDPAIGHRMINARSETVAEKPAFRAALRRRRCLVPADGFYEWAGPATRGGAKQPHYFHPPDASLIAIAGLWERWTGGGGEGRSDDENPGGRRDRHVASTPSGEAADSEAIESVTLITTEANACVRPVHDRMPVLIERRDFALWLDPDVRDPERILPLLVPAPPDGLVHHAVDRFVNDPRNDDPRCIAPV